MLCMSMEKLVEFRGWGALTIFRIVKYYGGLMAQAARRSLPSAGVPSLRLGHSMSISWWTNRSPGRFYSPGFFHFPQPQISFRHFPTLIRSFHVISLCIWWCDRHSRPAPLLFTDLQYRCFIASHHGRLSRWCKWRACDVGKAKEGLENELRRRWSNGKVGEWAVT